MIHGSGTKFSVIGLLIVGFAVSVLQAAGTQFTYQGQLKENDQPVNGARKLHFEMWDSASGGTQLGVHDAGAVEIANGLFTVALNFGADPFVSDNPLWLEVSVDGTKLAPRQALTAAPLSLRTRGISVNAANNVGIGVDAQPNQRLYVAAEPGMEAAVRGEGDVRGVLGLATNDGSGVVGYASNAGNGVVGDVDGTGAALYGYARALSGVNYGVFAVTDSADGYAGYFDGRGYFSGPVGINSSPVADLTIAGKASINWSLNPYEALHVEGQDAAIWGRAYESGVYGSAISEESGTGVIGSCAAASGYGVWGNSYHDSGAAIGVGGRATSTSGIGVRGVAEATSGQTYGVLGQASSSAGYGVYSNGNFAANGTKSFQIDHPLDPENRILNHYCAEGPEPMNIYSGTITLDQAGAAVVQLPAYFEAINRDFRYQLTPLGAPMPNLYVAVEVRGNEFGIAGGVAGKRVSWQLSAVRNDRWVQTVGAPTEVDKTPQQRGRYLTPALYGHPELSIINAPPMPGVRDTR